MKAKDYYRILQESSNDEEKFEKALENILKSMSDEVDELIRRRNAKSNDAIAGCVKEIDQKWRALVALHNKKKEKFELDGHLGKVILLDDGFKAVYMRLHPGREWMFDMKKHEQHIDKLKAQEEQKAKIIESFAPYKVTPFEKLTVKDLNKEILACCMALGYYRSIGIPVDWFKPLAYRVALLRHWNEKGIIDLTEAEEFEKDNKAWVDKMYNNAMI